MDTNEKHGIHSKSDNIEIRIIDEADEVIEELFKLIKNRYQNNLESIKGSEFIFSYIYTARKTIFFFPDALKRWSFQKNYTGT